MYRITYPQGSFVRQKLLFMKLSKFEIKNFKNLSIASFDWNEIIFLIGENNCGKSSVLHALDWFLSGKQIKDKALFHDEICDETAAIELIGHFTDLTDEEKSNLAVQNRMHGNSWILKKKFWLEIDNGKENWQEKYYSYGRCEAFAGWPGQTSSWNNWPAEYQPFIVEVKNESSASRPNDTAKELLKQKVRDNRSDLITATDAWSENPGGGGNWKSNANSILPQFIFVQAVHSISEETQAKDATTYGKIINLILERKLAVRPEVKTLNENLKRVQALFKSDPEHPEWPQADEIARLETDISTKLSEIIEAKALIEPKNMDLRTYIMPNTVLKIDDGFKTDIALQGHGLQRSLLITLFQILNQYSKETNESSSNIIDKRPVIFGIEEPEIYMHPQMIRRMKDVLVALAAQEKYQVICTTHSPAMLDISDSHKNIVRFKKDSSRNITVFQVSNEIFVGANAKDEKDRLKMILEFDASVNELFFAKRVVLVEGETEVAIFQKSPDLLNLFPTDPGKKRDITFVNCHAKGQIPLFIKVLNNFAIDYVVVHDIDTEPTEVALNKIIAETVKPGTTVITFNPKLEAELGYANNNKKALVALKKLEDLVRSNSLPSGFKNKIETIFGV